MPLTPDDYVHVKNTGTNPIELKWDGRAVTIKPGKVGFATFDQMVNAFGHPWSSDSPSRWTAQEGAVVYHIPSRPSEIQRLGHKYGLGIGQASHEFGIADLVPQAEVYDQDDNRIWCVLDDPTGSNFTAPTTSQISAGDSIAKLERQLALLKAQVNATSVAPGDEEETEVPPDND